MISKMVRDSIWLDLENSGARRTEMQVRILTHPLARIKIRGQLISFSLKGSMNKWARNAKMCHGT